MVKSVEKDDTAFLSFCDRDVFGTRIKAYFNCYSIDYDFVNFWMQINEDGEVTAAISRIDGDMTLCAYDADYEELLEFVKIVGFNTIQCKRTVAKELADDETLWGYVVRFEDERENREVNIKNNFELKEIYDIIKAENLTGVGDYLPWLSDTTFRINRNTAKPLLAEVDGNAAGCAMVLFRTDKAALLGAVATSPCYRGRGIAGALVTRLANDELAEGRRTELLCKNDSIVDFYKSIGFTVRDEWSLITDETKLF
ncbi:MAG: GNAT family N-acetyltransferase [Clostridia bacterium]|nr:GNAT family N-acetyltransferase [Clostridia bacterium]